MTLGVSETENTYEILIGDTGRAESTALKSTLSGDGYALKVVGNKIVAVASNDAYLYEAIDLSVCVKKRISEGSTGPASVSAQIARLEGFLAQ